MNEVKHFLKNVRFAGQGLAKAWRHEPNFRSEVVAAILVILVGYLLDISHVALAVLFITSLIVIALELVNTMVESVADMLKPRLDEQVKHIKDLSAAAVAVAAIGSIGVALCLLVPPIVNLLWQ